MATIRLVLTALLVTLLLAAPAQGASVKGTWKGTVHSHGRTFPVKMTIKRTTVGSRAGKLSNPGTPCYGTLRVRSRRNGSVSLRYKERSGSSRCTGDDRIFVKRKGAKLSWRAVAPSGQVGTALLHRV
jgi:hypothetical protein